MARVKLFIANFERNISHLHGWLGQIWDGPWASAVVMAPVLCNKYLLSTRIVKKSLDCLNLLNDWLNTIVFDLNAKKYSRRTVWQWSLYRCIATTRWKVAMYYVQANRDRAQLSCRYCNWILLSVPDWLTVVSFCYSSGRSSPTSMA